jgi:hypothetical protein
MYLAIIASAISGIALMAISGAGPVLFSVGKGALPEFSTFSPFYGHVAAAGTQRNPSRQTLIPFATGADRKPHRRYRAQYRGRRR